MTEVDIILDILKLTLKAKPESTFIKSLYDQYCNRGGLSKKQLQGLHSKASKIPGIAIGKLATLEAIIKKKPTRFKSEGPSTLPLQTKDASIAETLNAILVKYPQHKRVIFLQSKYLNNDPISAAEINEIEKFKSLLLS